MVFGILSTICMGILTILASIVLINQIKRIAMERKAKKEFKKLNAEIDNLMAKIIGEIISDSMKKEAEKPMPISETEVKESKTTTRKRKQSDKKED